jgi:hypothetical protein
MPRKLTKNAREVGWDKWEIYWNGIPYAGMGALEEKDIPRGSFGI